MIRRIALFMAATMLLPFLLAQVSWAGQQPNPTQVQQSTQTDPPVVVSGDCVGPDGILRPAESPQCQAAAQSPAPAEQTAPAATAVTSAPVFTG